MILYYKELIQERKTKLLDELQNNDLLEDDYACVQYTDQRTRECVHKIKSHCTKGLILTLY